MKRHPVPHHLGAGYVRDYNRGWAARPGAGEFSWVNVSRGYEDGYLDRASSYEKWHLPYCVTDDSCCSGDEQ